MRHRPNLCVIICLSRTFRQDVKAILTKIPKKIISQKITLSGDQPNITHFICLQHLYQDPRMQWGSMPHFGETLFFSSHFWKLFRGLKVKRYFSIILGRNDQSYVSHHLCCSSSCWDVSFSSNKWVEN